MRIQTVGDLLDQLLVCQRHLPVRLAFQPHHPIETTIGPISFAGGSDGLIVYIGQGDEQDYLPADAAEALGWG